MTNYNANIHTYLEDEPTVEFLPVGSTNVLKVMFGDSLQLYIYGTHAELVALWVAMGLTLHPKHESASEANAATLRFVENIHPDRVKAAIHDLDSLQTGDHDSAINDALALLRDVATALSESEEPGAEEE